MKRFANISIVSLALITLFAGAAMAEEADFYNDDESGYQYLVEGSQTISSNDIASADKYELQNKVDLKLDRLFSEVQVTPNECTAGDKVIFLASMARTDIITGELGFE